MPKYSKRFLETKHPTLYAKREKGGPVTLYKDEHAQELHSIYPLGHPKRPRHGRQWFTADFFRWKLEWLPEPESVTQSTPSPSNTELENDDQKR